MWRQPVSWPRRSPARTATESKKIRRSGRRQREPRGWCGSARALPYRAVASSYPRRAGGLSVHHELESMPVRVAEVDAAILPPTLAHRDAVFLQFRLQGFVSPSRHVERQMVEVVAGRQRRAARLLEQSDPLFPGVQKNLSFVFPIHGHAENLGVKSFRALDIVDVQHDVVHPIRLNHRSLLNFAAGRGPATVTSALSDLNSRTRGRSERTGAAGPLPFGGIGNPDQSCRRQPVAIEMGGGSPQM